MRVPILVSSIIVSLLFIIAIGTNSLAGPNGNGNGNGKNCEELLVPEPVVNYELQCFEYECLAIRDDGDEFDWDFEFFVADKGSFDNVLQAEFESDEQGDGFLGCQCKSTGSFTNPKFDTSNEFHCVGAVGDNFFSYEGHVVANGDRIQQGEAVNEFGRSFVFECDFEGPPEECD